MTQRGQDKGEDLQKKVAPLATGMRLWPLKRYVEDEASLIRPCPPEEPKV